MSLRGVEGDTIRYNEIPYELNLTNEHIQIVMIVSFKIR